MNRCELCKCWYKITGEMVSNFTMDHPDGESLNMAIISCPHCEQLQIPEQMNTIAYVKEEPEDKYWQRI